MPWPPTLRGNHAIDMLNNKRRTSELLSTALALKEAKTSFLTCIISVAYIFSALMMPLLTKPRARASAIWPAPMNPILFESIVFFRDPCSRRYEIVKWKI